MSLDLVATLERTLFDDDLAVERNDHDAAQLLGLPGSVSDRTLIHLCGAPAGARVDVESDGQAMILSVAHPTLIKTVNEVSVVKIKGTLCLSVDMVDLADTAPQGTGPVMLWRIVRGCMALAIPRIFGFAVGGRKFKTPAQGERLAGYYAWPRMGFDAPVTNEDVKFFQNFPYYPEDLENVRRLRHLFAKLGGAEFWKVNGTHRDVEFEVADRSESVQTLFNYMIEKGFITV